MVTDDKGEKMSKVKGNTIDPVDVIQEHGADALRFALAWLTTPAAQGKNIKFSISNVEDARRFANKIWNSARYVQMNLEGYDPERFADQVAEGPDRAELDLPERWILSRVQRAAEEVDTALEEYRIADAAQAAYHFVWDELCDWYIELAKAGFKRIAGDSEADREARSKIQGTLVTALETAMRLLHPFMPFLTEEIWQRLPKASGSPQSIMITLYPVRDVRFYDDASESSMALVQKVIVALRSIRTERKIPSSVRVRALLAISDDYKKTILEGYKLIIAEQGRCSEVRVRRSGASFSGEFQLAKTAMMMAGDVEVMVPLDGLVDTDSEIGRLDKEKAKLETTRDYCKKKLANPSFTDRAPLDVVDKIRAELAEAETALVKIDLALRRLRG
jgi:valyl-tRNA synthetase